jgi:choline monooxygenase
MQLNAEITRELKRVADPSNQTAGLENEWYTSPDRFDYERTKLFERSWFAVGYETSIPNVGDLAPVEMFGVPLLLVRDRDQKIRVFHNVCSHRGIVLVDKPTNTTALIRCRYHSWCYGLDGQLRSTPHIGGADNHEHAGVDKKLHGLKEVRATTLLGVIFATLSSDTPPFEVYAATLIERWKEFIPAQRFHSGADSVFEIQFPANWKLVVENFLESYHLPWVHPGLQSYSRMQDHDYTIADTVTAGQISLAYRPTLRTGGKGFVPLKGISNYWRERGEYLALYPNALIGVHADHLFITILQPVSPGFTKEYSWIGYFDESAMSEQNTELRTNTRDNWRDVTREDIFACEDMQKGRRSPAFKGGVLTPVLERTTRHFHTWAADRLLGGTPQPTIRAAE